MKNKNLRVEKIGKDNCRFSFMNWNQEMNISELSNRITCNLVVCIILSNKYYYKKN